MEYPNRTEINQDLGPETRVLTPREFLDLERKTYRIEINIPKLLKDNPDLVVEIAQTKHGEPLEITIKEKGVILLYDNLEAIERLKIQKLKPKNVTH